MGVCGDIANVFSLVPQQANVPAVLSRKELRTEQIHYLCRDEAPQSERQLLDAILGRIDEARRLAEANGQGPVPLYVGQGAQLLQGSGRSRDQETRQGTDAEGEHGAIIDDEEEEEERVQRIEGLQETAEEEEVQEIEEAEEIEEYVQAERAEERREQASEGEEEHGHEDQEVVAEE